MRNFNQKKIWRRVLESWPVLALLAIVVLFFAWGVVGLLGKMIDSRENRKLAELKIVELEKERAGLSSEISKLNTAAGVEASIREKYGLVKEGEGEIIIVEPKKEPKEEKEESSGFFSFIKNLFH